jgi:preprotein translocase subunit SecG
MYPIILTIHIIVCVLVVLIVLIQAGRSGGFSGLMGGGGGDAIFSTSSQQSGLRKATVILAAVFMATSLFLTILSSRQTGQSVFQRQFPALPQPAAPDIISCLRRRAHGLFQRPR